MQEGESSNRNKEHERGAFFAGEVMSPMDVSAIDSPLAELAHARATLDSLSPDLRAAYRSYVPPSRAERPGGDLDDATTLARVLPSAAAEGEVMLMCLGNDGTLRMGANLVLSFRALGLSNMLVMAPDSKVCARLWEVLPTVACVWWPSEWARARPPSLYNDMFSRVALAFFEARKKLLETLVLRHRLNVLHLDGDTVWFANPYPLLKTVYKDHQLIFQTDNPFVNAGVFYVQNVRDGDASAWVLQELNRRVARFTYQPESVRQLPNSGWARAPYFANADEQANLNDIVASSLSGAWPPSYAGGVEFAEARFKERFAPRRCMGKVRGERSAPPATLGPLGASSPVPRLVLLPVPGRRAARRSQDARVGRMRRGGRRAPADA